MKTTKGADLGSIFSAGGPGGPSAEAGTNSAGHPCGTMVASLGVGLSVCPGSRSGKRNPVLPFRRGRVLTTAVSLAVLTVSPDRTMGHHLLPALCGAARPIPLR